MNGWMRKAIGGHLLRALSALSTCPCLEVNTCGVRFWPRIRPAPSIHPPLRSSYAPARPLVLWLHQAIPRHQRYAVGRRHQDGCLCPQPPRRPRATAAARWLHPRQRVRPRHGSLPHVDRLGRWRRLPGGRRRARRPRHVGGVDARGGVAAHRHGLQRRATGHRGPQPVTAPTHSFRHICVPRSDSAVRPSLAIIYASIFGALCVGALPRATAVAHFALQCVPRMPGSAPCCHPPQDGDGTLVTQTTELLLCGRALCDTGLPSRL